MDSYFIIDGVVVDLAVAIPALIFVFFFVKLLMKEKKTIKSDR